MKLNELYGAVEKHLKAHIQNSGEKRRETSLSLFNPSVPYIANRLISGRAREARLYYLVG